MKDREWQIGLFGTFDIENYGDLLFPLVAEAELSERLGSVKLHRFSYHARTPPEWPYAVTSLTELPEMINHLDGVLIGGGFIIRFDKEVAPGYKPPTPMIHHPTGYWLTPALMALQHGVPVVWNAPGMNCNEIPGWADPLMELALTLSRYIAVRDEPSQAALTRYAKPGQIAVVPDTAFGITRLLDESPSNEFNRLCETANLTGPYLIFQAAPGLETILRFIKNQAQRLRHYRILALPICPGLGDQAEILGDDLPGLVRLSTWPSPLLLAELISRAEAVVGRSYHLSITALATGVPVFTAQDLHTGRFSALAGFETIYSLPKNRELDADWLMARIGRAAPSPSARATLGQLGQHWDQIAKIIQAGLTNTPLTVNQFWQSLPSLLEGDTKARTATAEALSLARAELALRDRRIASFQNSMSWKVTLPLRFLRNKLLGEKKDRR